MSNIISVKNITKKFGDLVANDNISLNIEKGDIFAIVGENGAGKSTLMKILYGMEQPTEGEIYIKGEKINKLTPKLAIKKGIGMIHQHFILVPSFTVAENVTLGIESRKYKFLINNKKNEENVEQLSKKMGLHIDPKLKIKDIPLGLQQKTEILKALYRGADVLILDEPTAVLTPDEIKDLFKILNSLVKENNLTIILITHKLNEVMSISNKVAVVRKGKLIHIDETKNLDERKLSQLMIGKDILFNEVKKNINFGDTYVKINDVCIKNKYNKEVVKDVSFSVHSGEIIGIAGIEGNGQSQLIEGLMGLRKVSSGSINILNTDVTNKKVAYIRKVGVSYIPEDRLKNGVSKDSSIEENLLTGKQYYKQFSNKKIILKRKSIRKYSLKLTKKYNVKTENVEENVSNLSGGNIQKLIIAREFEFDSKVLIISQPTRGVDIGAIEFIHKKIIEKSKQGVAIILVSAEIDELIRLCNTIYTIKDGKFSNKFDGKFNKTEMGYFMT